MEIAGERSDVVCLSEGTESREAGGRAVVKKMGLRRFGRVLLGDSVLVLVLGDWSGNERVISLSSN